MAIVEPSAPASLKTKHLETIAEERLRGSLDRQAELVWNAVSNLSPAGKAQVLYWADGIGTFTPPGHWAQIALDELDTTNVDLGEKLFIVGATMIAVNDAVIACWRDKYTFGVPRPSQVSSKIEPVIPNPNFPAYPSGHSVISTAASHVLASYVPTLAASGRNLTLGARV